MRKAATGGWRPASAAAASRRCEAAAAATIAAATLRPDKRETFVRGGPAGPSNSAGFASAASSRAAPSEAATAGTVGAFRTTVDWTGWGRRSATALGRRPDDEGDVRRPPSSAMPLPPSAVAHLPPAVLVDEALDLLRGRYRGSSANGRGGPRTVGWVADVVDATLPSLVARRRSAPRAAPTFLQGATDVAARLTGLTKGYRGRDDAATLEAECAALSRLVGAVEGLARAWADSGGDGNSDGDGGAAARSGDDRGKLRDVAGTWGSALLRCHRHLAEVADALLPAAATKANGSDADDNADSASGLAVYRRLDRLFIDVATGRSVRLCAGSEDDHVVLSRRVAASLSISVRTSTSAVSSPDGGALVVALDRARADGAPPPVAAAPSLVRILALLAAAGASPGGAAGEATGRWLGVAAEWLRRSGHDIVAPGREYLAERARDSHSQQWQRSMAERAPLRARASDLVGALRLVGRGGAGGGVDPRGAGPLSFAAALGARAKCLGRADPRQIGYALRATRDWSLFMAASSPMGTTLEQPGLVADANAVGRPEAVLADLARCLAVTADATDPGAAWTAVSVCSDLGVRLPATQLAAVTEGLASGHLPWRPARLSASDRGHGDGKRSAPPHAWCRALRAMGYRPSAAFVEAVARQALFYCRGSIRLSMHSSSDVSSVSAVAALDVADALEFSGHWRRPIPDALLPELFSVLGDGGGGRLGSSPASPVSHAILSRGAMLLHGATASGDTTLQRHAVALLAGRGRVEGSGSRAHMITVSTNFTSFAPPLIPSTCSARADGDSLRLGDPRYSSARCGTAASWLGRDLLGRALLAAACLRLRAAGEGSFVDATFGPDVIADLAGSLSALSGKLAQAWREQGAGGPNGGYGEMISEAEAALAGARAAVVSEPALRGWVAWPGLSVALPGVKGGLLWSPVGLAPVGADGAGSGKGAVAVLPYALPECRGYGPDGPTTLGLTAALIGTYEALGVTAVPVPAAEGAEAVALALAAALKGGRRGGSRPV